MIGCSGVWAPARLQGSEPAVLRSPPRSFPRLCFAFFKRRLLPRKHPSDRCFLTIAAASDVIMLTIRLWDGLICLAPILFKQ